MKHSVFIASSLDGFIATEDGGVSWLETTASPISDIEQNSELMQRFNDAFQNYMKSIGKLGGQNKIPRVSDNRKIATALTQFLSTIK